MNDGTSDADLVRRLLDGEEAAFRSLVADHHTNMVRLARSFVRNAATAEEVAQETWLKVLEGLDRFEGRSSLKTWIFTILANRARSRAVRDGRMLLFSDLSQVSADNERAVDPSRFDAAGRWSDPPREWDQFSPERSAASAEILSRLSEALDELPEAQRAIVLLRDVEGCTSREACNILGISETNQRVLLHRGRSRLRRLLEPLMEKRRS